MLRRLLAVCALVLMSPAVRADDGDIVKRGEYLARAGDCVACHTEPGAAPYSGGRRIDTPYGPIYSPNLTPDKETGIGAWSDDEFYRAMHEGIGKDGEYLYPVFPFPWYTKVTRDDALAIKAYLFTLKPEHSPEKPNGFSFPYNVRTALAAWRLAFFRTAEPKAPAPGDKLGRGAYLVEGLGHCGECHNRSAARGASNWSGQYEGGAIQGWYAPNITGDPKQGIGGWSEDDLVTFLKTGAAAGHGVALGPMQETISESLSHLTDDDLRAMAAYLKSIPPKQTFANTEGAYANKDAPGADAYVSHCSTCHGVDGRGKAGRIPALAGNGSVLAGGPQNVIQAVLGGLAPSHGLGPMPAVGASLGDEDVAKVVDYVRNHFGNAAPATSDPGEIAKLRRDVATPMAPKTEADCGKVESPEVQAIVEGGELAKLVHVEPPEQQAAIDALLQKLAPLTSKSPNLAVADLTAGFCQVIARESGGSVAEKARAIGDFATRVYAQALHPAGGSN